MSPPSCGSTAQCSTQNQACVPTTADAQSPSSCKAGSHHRSSPDHQQYQLPSTIATVANIAAQQLTGRQRCMALHINIISDDSPQALEGQTYSPDYQEATNVIDSYHAMWCLQQPH
mmetsp:Transcript_10526/g.31698  ORF Transcript_10526/g.31698 Transcript_10526/m.31698 type:complete len:116 (+) Transcript_10526:652-999(+)